MQIVISTEHESKIFVAWSVYILHNISQEIYAMTLAQRILKRREQLHFTQEELAARSGISQGLISRIERGLTPSPGVLVLRRLARALMCSIDWLVSSAFSAPAC